MRTLPCYCLLIAMKSVRWQHRANWESFRRPLKDDPLALASAMPAIASGAVILVAARCLSIIAHKHALARSWHARPRLAGSTRMTPNDATTRALNNVETVQSHRHPFASIHRP